MLASGRLLPGLMSACGPVSTAVADRQPDRRQDVALGAVRVVQQRNARRAVRIVLDRLHGSRHADLLAPEVDDPVEALVTAAAMARRHPAAVVAAARLRERRHERRLGPRLGDLAEVEAGAEATPGRRGTELDDRHRLRLPRRSRCGCPRRASRTPSSSRDGAPDVRPTRRIFPIWRWVRTLCTFTLKRLSTAWRISTLLACGCTRNTTWLPSSFTSVPFSVTIGPCTTSVAFMPVRSPPAGHPHARGPAGPPAAPWPRG